MNQAGNGNLKASCAVRGSINHDEYFYVHHIARPGETLSSYDHESRVGGKGANQAVTIARAGGVVKFYGTIGDDGVWVRERMERWGVGVEGILVGDEPTGRAIIQVDEQGENSIILFPGANHSELHEQRFASHADGPGWFPETTHLLLQNEISMRSTYYALEHAREGTTVILNPSPLPSNKEIRAFPWHRVDWLLVNEREARGLFEALTGRNHSSASPNANRPGSSGSHSQTQLTLSNRELIARLSALPSFSNVNIVCTLGADGVLAFVPAFHRPRTAVEAPSFMHLPAAKLVGGVRDTTGAGDCFAGYFVQGLMEFGGSATVGYGREIREGDVLRLLKVCVQAAGMCVEKPGTIDSIPTRAQVEERMAMAMSG